MKQFMFKKFFQFLFSLFCGVGSLFGQSNDSLNILFIGNSYTHMNSMPRIFDKIAKAKGQKVYVRMNTHSGYSFKQHHERSDMFDAINRREWDYIVLQGYSREFIHSFEHIDTATVPYLTSILDTIRSNSPCTKVLFYMTWGYKEGYTELPETDNYTKMTDSIARGYEYVSAILDLPIAPVGRVWEKVRTSHPALNLYAPDAAHPSKNGSYLAACTFYASIFNDSPKGVYTNTIGAEEAYVIQEAATEYVKETRTHYKLDRNTFEIEHTALANGKFLANFAAFFPTAKSIIWSFGDGTQSTQAIAKHQYAKPGKYLVDLEVTDQCGSKCYSKEIHLKKSAAGVVVPEKGSSKIAP